MLPLVRAYVAECKRERVQPFSGFIAHVASCVVDADLDDVPVATIDLFARAMVRAGESDQGSSTTPDPRTGHSAYMTAESAGAASSPRVAALCLHHTPLSGPSASRTPPPPSQLASPCPAAVSSSASLQPETAGAAVRRERADAKDITAPSQRPSLKLLVDGVRVTVTGSRDCLHTLVLSGLPLDTVPVATTRLMRVLPTSANLRVLNLSDSGIGSTSGLGSRRGATPGATSLFTVLTSSTPGGFARLEVASFANCGLTDAEAARGVRSLLAARHDRTTANNWQQSLRGGGGGAGAAVASSRDETGASAAADSGGGGTGLRHLDLSGNALSTLTLRALQHGLLDDTSLLTLDLSRNQCSTQAISAFLFSGVLERCRLQSIDLSHNKQTTTRTLDVGAVGGPPSCPANVAALFACIHTPVQQQLLYLRRAAHPLQRTPAPSPTPMPATTAEAVPATQHTITLDSDPSSIQRAKPVAATAADTVSGAARSGDGVALSQERSKCGPGRNTLTITTTVPGVPSSSGKEEKTAKPLPGTSPAPTVSSSSRSQQSLPAPLGKAHLHSRVASSAGRGAKDGIDLGASAVSSLSHLQNTVHTLIQISPTTTSPNTSSIGVGGGTSESGARRDRRRDVETTNPCVLAASPPHRRAGTRTAGSEYAPATGAGAGSVLTPQPSSWLGSYCIPIVPYGMTTAPAPPGVPPPPLWCGWQGSYPPVSGSVRAPTMEQGTQTLAADTVNSAENAPTATTAPTQTAPDVRTALPAPASQAFDPLLTASEDGKEVNDSEKEALADAEGTAKDEDGAVPLTVEELLAAPPSVIGPPTTMEADGTVAVVSPSHLSEAEERRFLLSLVGRVEGFENELTEKLEHHYQQTNDQLLALKRDLLVRLSGLSDDHKAAVQRLQTQQEATAEAVEHAITVKHQHPESDMMDSLVDLIQTGIQRINDQMSARIETPEAKTTTNAPTTSSLSAGGVPSSIFGFTDTSRAAGTTRGGPSAASSLTTKSTAEKTTEKDFLKDVNARLMQLGW